MITIKDVTEPMNDNHFKFYYALTQEVDIKIKDAFIHDNLSITYVRPVFFQSDLKLTDISVVAVERVIENYTALGWNICLSEDKYKLVIRNPNK